MLATHDQDIIVRNSVTLVEGLYYVVGNGSTNGIFQTGTRSPGKDDQLTLSGVFIASAFDLERNLKADNATFPAEVFYYKPTLALNAPEFLMVRYTVWEEVAP